MLQALKQLYLTGINSQAALHGADTETMIGSNAPTRIKFSRQVFYLLPSLTFLYCVAV
jgi:hypothetical protein